LSARRGVGIGIGRRRYWRQQIRVGLKRIIGTDWNVGQLRSGHRRRLIIFRHTLSSRTYRTYRSCKSY
jgi:hypothetical protein